MEEQQQITSRIEEMDSLIDTTKYSKQKQALQRELEEFLRKLSPDKSLDTATPLDIRHFLVWQEKQGKTRVHTQDFTLHVSPSQQHCQCPTRLAASSVDSIIGQIRAIFRDRGRGGQWLHSFGIGNPAAAPAVKKHLKAVRVEQSGVKPKQAIPLSFQKLATLNRYLDYQAYREARINPQKKLDQFLLRRDSAYFKVLCHTGNRGSDLGQVKSGQLQWLPGHTGFTLEITEGKTTKGRKSHEVTVLASADPDICPVQSMKSYLEIASSMGWNLTGGFLFLVQGKTKSLVNKPALAQAMTARLKKHLQAMGTWEGETTHSARGGCAITLMLLGVDPDDACAPMLKHYTQDLHKVQSQKTAQTLADAARKSGQESSDLQKVEEQFNVAARKTISKHPNNKPNEPPLKHPPSSHQ